MTLQQMIDASRRIVFFGGAGVSTESGIPDFRSVDGLYHQRYAWPPETIISRSFFDRMPEEFFRFYRDKLLLLDAKPNAAHLKLAELERAGRLSAVITQNIDGLHTKAGSRCVFEIHGSIWRNHCMRCGKSYGPEFIRDSEGVPRCSCGGIVKPDVVLYEEGLDDAVVAGAIHAMRQADLLIVAGTSLTVYPAAGLLSYYRGENQVLINRDATPFDGAATLVIREKVGEVLGAIRVTPPAG
ncbi:MAG: NAD-dependent protein deacylase [Clostridia bacterium]|nr:NAD-dependent protein deacylase [Clostridia bacterium]